MKLSFREAVRIQTAYGPLFFYLGQALEAVPEGRTHHRLTTRQYWYRIQHEPSLSAQATFRWEYDWGTARDRHARHHAQMVGEVELGDGSIDLNKAHLPTGWVTVEEVIRFLIVDLALHPPCGNEWPHLLEDSERRFYEDFTGKRHKPAINS